ncbi:MAG: DUF559 domain-containing protein [Propionibacteriaceae bacterium]|jgi:hypothetical protein|nr:DUF559 domain-containing protein [Propionibacteriaceae bacterium]
MRTESQIELTPTSWVNRHNYRHLGYERVLRGAYTKAYQAPGPDQWASLRADWLLRVRAAMALYADRDPVLYGSTALQALDIALPTEVADWHHVHLLVKGPADRPQRSNVVGHSTLRELDVWRRPRGLPVLHPVDHWLQLTGTSDDAMVEVGDGFVRRNDFLITLDEMRARLDELTGVQGVVRSRRAMLRVRAGTDSLYETRTRLLLVRGGLPEPQVNLEVWCPGVPRMYHVDLGYDEAKVAVEFDGIVHASTRDQMDLDANRRRHLQDEGWLIITVTATMLSRPAEIVRSVERALVLRRPTAN